MNRLEIARPSRGLWVAEGIYVRIGCLHHYDLYVERKSVVGEVIGEFVTTARLTDEDGKAKRLRLLIAEQVSQSSVS